MDINELRNKWAEMGSCSEPLYNTLSPEKMCKKKTAHEKLAAQYRRFVIFAAIFIIVSLTNLWRTFGSLMGILFAAYFLVALILDLIILKKVTRIDIARMTVVEVAVRARACRKAHHICQIILIPAAIALLGALCYSQSADEYFLWCCGAGALLGLCLGVMAYTRFMNNYKKLIE